MQTYIGTKIIQARPMTRQEYNDYRGWTLFADEGGNDAGFLVEYVDGGKANHPEHAGYISWSPADVFIRAYSPADALTFGLALESLKNGQKVAREGWNGKGMWICMIQRSSWQVNPKINMVTNSYSLDALPWIGMKTVDNGFVPWLASQTDMLAEDWMIVE